jgi:hypothetical protein
MFHFIQNSQEISKKLSFVNILQCKLLLANTDHVHLQQLLRDIVVSSKEIDEIQKFLIANKTIIENATLEPIVFRIMQWTQCLCTIDDPVGTTAPQPKLLLSAEDASVFVELLSACIEDNLFRVFLFLFLPSTSLLTNNTGHHHRPHDRVNYISLSKQDQAIAFIRYVSDQIRSVEWQPYRNSLTFFSYPKLNANNNHCEPTWQIEAAWIKDFFSKQDHQDYRIEWNELQYCLQPSAALSYTIYTKIIHPRYRLEMLKDIPIDYLISKFTLSTSLSSNNDDYHFYFLCLFDHIIENDCVENEVMSTNSTEANTKDNDILRVFINYSLVNDLFIERIFKYIFKNITDKNATLSGNNQLLSAYEILKKLIIVIQNNEPQLRSDILCMFKTLPQLIIDSLYEASNARKIAGSKSIMNRFFELLLLLENTHGDRKLSNLITLSKLFQSQPSYQGKVRNYILFFFSIFLDDSFDYLNSFLISFVN